jgi:hypothetical protein
MIFEELEFKELPHNKGIQAVVEFKNGYGASVVKGEYTYGGRDGFYELAVLKDSHLCYDTEIANDVLGFLTEAEVTVYLMQIESLSKNL